MHVPNFMEIHAKVVQIFHKNPKCDMVLEKKGR